MHFSDLLIHRLLYNDEYVIIFSKLGGICLNIFEIVGNDFFKPLSSPNKEIYYDCLNIIYNSYRTELSYGIDRDIVISQIFQIGVSLIVQLVSPIVKLQYTKKLSLDL